MTIEEFSRSTKFSFPMKVDYAPGGIVSKNVIKKETGNVSLFAFDAGEGLSEHTAPFDALIQIIEGRAEIIIDGKSYFLVSGDAIIMPANIPHAVQAPERFKMLLTMIRS
jgi:quercetin dioxygenase-like cupin family protein